MQHSTSFTCSFLLYFGASLIGYFGSLKFLTFKSYLTDKLHNTSYKLATNIYILMIVSELLLPKYT